MIILALFALGAVDIKSVNSQVWCTIFGGTCQASCVRVIQSQNLCPADSTCCHSMKSVCKEKYGGKCLATTASCDGEMIVSSALYGKLCEDQRHTCCMPGNSQVTPSTAATPDGCGHTFYPPPNKRLVGGSDARKGGWPWQVSITLDGRHHCGGAIISPQWILSAAHCFTQVSDHQRFKVHAGEMYLGKDDGSEAVRDAEEIILHSGYDPVSSSKDIALLRVKQQFQFNAFVNSVCLPKKSENYQNLRCWVSGWGLTHGTGDRFHLQQLHGKIVSTTYCKAAWPGRIDKGMVCFGDGTRGTCRGDSGGPLMCEASGKYHLVGVTSWGSADCTTPGQPNVFTRVSLVRKWIRRKAGV